MPGEAANADEGRQGAGDDGRIEIQGDQRDDAFLVWGESLLAWSPGGYKERRPRLKGEEVTALTPPSTVRSMRAGYVPEVHLSAGPA
jgi:hypothetical protein